MNGSNFKNTQRKNYKIMENTMKKGLVLLSGGIDSAVLLANLLNEGKQIETITFDYGQKHFTETDSAREISKYYEVKNHLLDVSNIQTIFNSALTDSSKEIPSGDYTPENAKQTVVPNRNMILISIASAYGMSNGFDFLAIGAHLNDVETYPDCRTNFLVPLRDALRNADWKSFDLLFPFVRLFKSEIVSSGSELKVPFRLTWSCYKGEGIHCKICPTCKERINAFKIAGVDDPTEYQE